MRKIVNLCVLASVLVPLVITSCAKEDVLSSNPTHSNAVNAIAQRYAVDPPYGTYEPGQEPAIPFKPPVISDTPSIDPQYPYQVITIPTKTYLDETCLLDLSNLEGHKTYHTIENENLTISLRYDSVLKLNAGPSGWNSRWGSAPNVVKENPDVLYLYNANLSVIYLSKPCVEFGFEMAPNHQDYDHKFGVTFGNDWLDYSEGFTSSIIKGPFGARLYAIRAGHPFTQITITNNDSPTGDIPADGIALANIRYRLAK